MKKVYIENLREGARVEDVFLVAQKAVQNTRDGKPFLKLRLADKTGQIDAVRWGASESEIKGLNENDCALFRGTVGLYNGAPQFTIDSFQRRTEGIDPADFIRHSAHDPDKMLVELRQLLGMVTQPQLVKLLARFFDDEDFACKFKEAPAARSIHHAFMGGLLEHTLNVVKCCAALAELYPDADRNLLLTGAALHDVGKTEELQWPGAIMYSDSGNLVGHVAGGTMMVKEAAEKTDGMDPLMSLALQHMILAHHGVAEYGSPKCPMSVEALILHHADDLDAKMAIFAAAIEESGGEGLFTKKHHLLDRRLFRGLKASEEAADLDQLAGQDIADPFADE